MDIAAAGRAKTGPTDDVVEHSSSDDDDNIASGARSNHLSSFSSDAPEEHRPHEVRHFRSSSRVGGLGRRRWSRVPEADTGLLAEDPLSREHDGVLFVRKTTFFGSLKEMVTSSWLNLLLVFVPIGVLTYMWDKSPILTFICNAIAIVPLSALLTDATERIASDTGDTIGALLNISLGNMVELILFVALVNRQILVVQASILGSIIVNLMLILGSALLASSVFDHEPVYNTAKTQLLSCLLFVCVFVFLMPTAFGYTFNNQSAAADKATLKMSRISSLIVFLVYVIYFVHELRARPLSKDKIASADLDLEEQAGGAESRDSQRGHASSSQGVSSRTIRFADESRQPSTTESVYRPTNRFEMDTFDIASSEFDATKDREERRWKDHALNGANGRPNPYQPPPRTHKRSRSISVTSSKGGRSREGSITGVDARGLMRPGLTTLQLLHTSRTSLEGITYPQVTPERSSGNRFVSVMMLILTSALMSMSAEFLVSTIDEVTHQGHLSEPLIGLIILPIVGNVSEYVTVVTVAAKNNLDLSIAVAVGSSIQIALCVAPLTVIAGWILDRDLSLTFNFFEMAMLVGSVLLVNLLMLNDGSSTLRTSGLKGGLMCACYVIIGIGAYLSPGE